MEIPLCLLLDGWSGGDILYAGMLALSSLENVLRIDVQFRHVSNIKTLKGIIG